MDVEPLTPHKDFPVEGLPLWARDFVECLAHVLQIDRAVVAISVLGATALAVQGMARVHVRARWYEQLAFWAFVTLRSGNRKSPALSQPLAPIRRWEKERNKALDIYRAEIERCAETNKKKPPRLRELNEAKPPRFNFYVTDATMEALALELKHQNEACGVITDEPTSIERVMSGIYSEGGSANIGILNSGYTGDSYRRARVKSEGAFLEHPVLTMVLFGQPGVFDELTKAKRLIDVGFVGRFFVSRPPDLLGQREVHNDEVPEGVRRAYEEAMFQILDAPRVPGSELPDIQHPEVYAGAFPPWPTGPLDRYKLKLTQEARVLHMGIEARIEPLLAEGAVLGDLSDFGGKLSGQIARWAGLLHVQHHVADWWRLPIDDVVMGWAIEIGRYSLGQILSIHSEKARADNDAKLADNAYDIACQIAANGGVPPMVTWSQLSRRLISGHGRGKIKSTEELDAIVDLLVQQGRLVLDTHYRRGRRWLVLQPS